MIAGTDSSSVLAGGLQSLGRKMGTIRKCKSLNGCTKKHNGKVNKTLKGRFTYISTLQECSAFYMRTEMFQCCFNHNKRAIETVLFLLFYLSKSLLT